MSNMQWRVVHEDLGPVIQKASVQPSARNPQFHDFDFSVYHTLPEVSTPQYHTLPEVSIPNVGYHTLPEVSIPNVGYYTLPEVSIPNHRVPHPA